ncbi:MAG: hypothetical protein QMB65_07045, partial [Vicingaceae bacterium]
MQKRIVYILPLLLVLFWTKTNAQNFNISNERTFSNLFNKHVDTLNNFHTSIKPFSKNEISDFDAIIDSYKTEKGDLIRNKHLINSSSKKLKLTLDPIVNMGITFEKNSTTS